MLRVRVIPCLLLMGGALVKTRRFRSPVYIGDPVNSVRIFNELEVDELAFLDISATREGRTPDFERLSQIANECFMPLSYGGGVASLRTAERLFAMGFEKVVVNSACFPRGRLVTELASRFGAQAVVASVDVRHSVWRGYRVHTVSGSRNTNRCPVEWAREMESRGAGEILLTSIDREGTWEGFDLRLTAAVADAVTVPVIANGGAGTVSHIGDVVQKGHASAVTLGSMVVFQGPGRGILVSFPDRASLAEALRPAQSGRPMQKGAVVEYE